MIGIVIATGSKAIRRIIVPDNSQSLTDGTHAVVAGETMLVMPGDAYDLATCNAFVEAQTGVTPPIPHCAVVDESNTVVAIVLADPAIDTHPDGKLVPLHHTHS